MFVVFIGATLGLLRGVIQEANGVEVSELPTVRNGSRNACSFRRIWDNSDPQFSRIRIFGCCSPGNPVPPVLRHWN